MTYDPELGKLAPSAHKRVFRTLSHAVTSNMVHHAYLFEGEEGVAKTETASWLAGLLLCEGVVHEEVEGVGSLSMPCGSCGGCGSLSRQQHPDLLEIAPPEGKKQILMEQVKELIQKVCYAPLRGNRRVIFIHRADRLGEVAANALLKTLEEPAPYNTFVLLTHRPQALLGTILSRCQRVRFAPLPRKMLVELLSGVGLDRANAHVLAAASGGSFGKARALNEADFLEQAQVWLNRYLSPGTDDSADPQGAIAEAGELAQAYRKNPDPTTSGIALLLTTLRLGLRDILLCSSGTVAEQLTWPGRREITMGIGEKISISRLRSLMDRVLEAEEVFLRPLNPTLVVEDTLLRVVTSIR